MESTELKRVFNFDGKELSDPDPKMSTAAVLKFHSIEHPELMNASIDGGEIKDGKLQFEITTSIGSKG